MRKSDHLILRADKSLLRDLEIPEWGQPVALGAVLVCLSFFLSLFVCFCFSVQDTGVLMCVLGVLGRGDAEPDDCAVAGV